MTHLSPSELYILEKLSNGPLPTASVVETTEGFSSPTLYTALRSLAEQHILTKVGDMVLLNIFWIENEVATWQKLASAHTKIGRKKPQSHQLRKFPTDLGPGEKVRYKFKNYYQLDTFWMTVPVSLMATVVGNSSERWLVWEPLPFWRLYSERDFLQTSAAIKKYLWELLYACLPLENLSGKTMISWARKNDIRASVIDDARLKKDEYINVHGPFVITTRLGTLHKKLEDLFKKSGEVDKQVLEELLRGEYDLTLTIEHNQKKANNFQKVFAKYFIEKR
jgi:hypothetical protein